MVFIWVIVGLIAVGVTFDRVLRMYAAPRIADLFEDQPPFNVVSASEQCDATLFTIPTTDGLKLSASYLAPEQAQPVGLIIFFPELNGNHWMARRYCDALLQSGFAILGFDFRNQGSSESLPGYTPIHWITDFEMQDVAAVLEYVESHPDLSTLPLAVFGVSRGGNAALSAGSRYPRIRAVIADSAFDTMSMMRRFVERFAPVIIPERLYQILPRWQIELTLWDAVRISERRRNVRYVHLFREASGLAETPVLLISGRRDSYVTNPVAADLKAIVGRSAELWTVSGAKHNMARQTATAEYDQRIVSHLARVLNPELAAEVTVDSSAIGPMQGQVLPAH